MQAKICKPSVCYFIFSLLATLTIIVVCACNTVLMRPISEKRIVEQANKNHEEIVQIRHDLHGHPELSGSESRTAEIVAAQLKSYGLEVHTGIGGYGVVGILRGIEKTPVVAYRADMDALPQEIQEQAAFKSTTPGISHACGHDVHTAVGLGVARVLSSLKDELPGTVVFIFQPAEENVEGAKRMIAEGVLTHPTPEAIFSIHVTPFETGTIVTTPGVGLPGNENFTIKLKGAKNLDAAASALVDSIRAIGTVRFPDNAEKLIPYFNSILERNSFLSSFVWAMTWAENGSSERERVIRGYFKASDKIRYSQARAQMQMLLSNLEKQGINFEMESSKDLPDMFCDKKLAEWAINPLQSVLGKQSVLYAYNSFPFFGEDFAYYLERVPGAMFFLGASNTQKGIHAIPHSPLFGVDEEAILVGVKGLSNVILQYMLNNPADN